jgi:hypothetical protein
MLNSAYMKSMIILTTSSLGFLCSYFLDLTLPNAEQFIAVAAVLLLDGFFGVIAGIKREGFKTYKALKVLKSIFAWEVILTVILMIEVGFRGTSWLSETIITPFIVFQLISALKNASMAGFIKNELLNTILDTLDKHKGKRTN